MPDTMRRPSLLPRWPAILLSALLLAACTDDDPAPEKNPAASKTTHQLRPGSHVDLTAVVTVVLSGNAFLIADADLPKPGQLVVTDTPVTVLATGLVTVAGRAEALERTALGRYGVSNPEYLEASGGVAIVATSVRRYLPESTAASGSSSTSPAG